MYKMWITDLCIFYIFYIIAIIFPPTNSFKIYSNKIGLVLAKNGRNQLPRKQQEILKEEPDVEVDFRSCE